jgi:hypothetical protein
MMIPLAEPQSAKEVAYNGSHKKCRGTIERAIGVLKSRFRCLCKQNGGSLQFDVRMCCNIIAACTVLHNYCRERNFPFEIAAEVAAIISETEDDVRPRASSSASASDEVDHVHGEDADSINSDDVVADYSARNALIDEFF